MRNNKVDKFNSISARRFTVKNYIIDSPYTFSDYKNKYPYMIVRDKIESVKIGVIDLKIKVETKENFKPNTIAYCLLIYDNIVAYSPLTSNVIKQQS